MRFASPDEGADCVVTLTAPFRPGWDGKLPPEVERTIRRRVAELKLPAKGVVLFRVPHKPGAEEAVRRFYEMSAKELADALGFKDRAMMSHSES